MPQGGCFVGMCGGFGRGRGNPSDLNIQEPQDMELGSDGDPNSEAIIPGTRKRLVGQDGTDLASSWDPLLKPHPAL